MPEDAPPSAIPRYRALYEALTSKKMEVRVLPDSAFGLIHGKAGVVRRADGSATAFLGSVNESASAWKINYELLWEDNYPATIASLRRCLELLKQGGNNDPKLEALIGYLLGTHPGVTRRWLDLGCILFSQYYDTVRWIGDEMARRAEFAHMDIGLYAGSNRSGFWREGKFQRCDRNSARRGRQRLAGYPALDVLQRVDVEHLHIVVDDVADVRRQHDVVEAPHDVVLRQRLGPEHVEARAGNFFRLQRADQRLLVDQRAA